MRKKLQIINDLTGNKVVVLPAIIFKNKQKIDWNAVEKYLQKYVGEIVTIAESKDIVYIGAAGRMYLYDLVDIKREASTPLTIR